MWYATGKIMLKHTVNWFIFLNSTRLVKAEELEFIMKNQVMLCCVAGSIVPDVLKDHTAIVLWKVRQALSTLWHNTTFEGSTLQQQHCENNNPITYTISIIKTFLLLINNVKIQYNSTSRFTYRKSQELWLQSIKYSHYNKRRKCDSHVQICNTSLFNKSVINMGITLYNNMPNRIK